MINRYHGPRRQAFTMVEVLVAILILSVAVIAIMQTITSGHMHALETMDQLKAVFLAESLTEEVLAYPYLDPDGDSVLGPDNGENDRGQYDAIDDFDGYVQAVGDLRDVQGNLLDESYQNFSRSVWVYYDTPRVNTVGGSFDAAGVVFEVVVTDNHDRSLTLTRFVEEPIP